MSITLEVVQVVISFQDLSKIPTESFLLSQVLPSPMVPVWCGTGDQQKQNIFWQKAKVLGKIKYKSLLNQTRSNCSQLAIPQDCKPEVRAFFNGHCCFCKIFPQPCLFGGKGCQEDEKVMRQEPIPVGPQRRTLEGADREVCPLLATLRSPEQGTGF